jgi:hypothetical protein
MSLGHGASIVTDGLVFYYDMDNIQKSWRGAPTTNLTPDMQLTGMGFGLTFTYVGLENGWKKYSIDGTWTGETYPYSFNITSVAFTGGVTYSSGVFVKTNVPNKFATLFTGMNYVNEPMNNAGASFSIAQPDGSFFVGRSGFQYTSTTTQPGYILSQPVIGQTFSSASDFVYIKDGQVETGSFPTPFTSGTRSNSQALLDLTNQNTITATSLTYASNNTFSFNGSTDFISTALVGTSTSFTHEVFLRPTDVSKDQMYIGYSTITSHQVRIVNSRAFLSVLTSGGRRTFTDSQILLNNTTYHIVSCYNGVQLKIYVNGVLSLGSVLNEPLTGWGINRIGRWLDGDQRSFVGTIFNMKTYNRELTAAEVSQNLNALRGRYGI